MSLFDDFIQFRDEKLKLAQDYELTQSYEMAYVALWSITEHTVKIIEELRRSKELRKQVLSWYEFFESNSAVNRPEPIKSFVCEVRSIPEIKLIQKSLGTAPAIAKLLQTKQKGKSSKYRDKRNAIAHHADKFKDVKVYHDYKKTALAAISELEKKLKETESK
jgi:hypothetical protein